MQNPDDLSDQIYLSAPEWTLSGWLRGQVAMMLALGYMSLLFFLFLLPSLMLIGLVSFLINVFTGQDEGFKPLALLIVSPITISFQFWVLFRLMLPTGRALSRAIGPAAEHIHGLTFESAFKLVNLSVVKAIGDLRHLMGLLRRIMPFRIR